MGVRLRMGEELPLEVGFGLSRVLREEQRLQERMRDFRNDIASRSGYKIYQLFELVAAERDHDISANDIRLFLREHGIPASTMDVAFIVQRLDRDRDGRVSYMDLLDALLPFEPPTRPVRVPMSEPRERASREYRYSSPQPRSEIKARGSAISSSPERELSKRTEQARVESPPKLGRVRRPEDEFRPIPIVEAQKLAKRPKDFGVQAPEPEEEEQKQETEPAQQRAEAPKKLVPRELSEEESQREQSQREPVVAFKTPERAAPESPEYPTTGDTPARPVVVTEREAKSQAEMEQRNREIAEALAKVFREQISLDKEAESARERLCLKIDYHVQDAFNYFDVKKKGSISLYELRTGLGKLRIRTGFEELMQLMKRYDLDANGSLSPAEFERMLLPRKQYYADLLKKRTPKAEPGEMTFSQETRVLFAALMQALIDAELVMEKLRRKVSEGKTALNFEDAFGVCEPDGEGFVSAAGVSEMMKRGLYFVSEADVGVLMNRYDKDLDGRVSFSEVLISI